MFSFQIEQDLARSRQELKTSEDKFQREHLQTLATQQAKQELEHELTRCVEDCKHVEALLKNEQQLHQQLNVAHTQVQSRTSSHILSIVFISFLLPRPVGARVSECAAVSRSCERANKAGKRFSQAGDFQNLPARPSPFLIVHLHFL